MLHRRPLRQRERTFHITATLKEVQEELKEVQQNVQHLEEKVADTRSRLREVEDNHRKMEDSLCSKTRDTIEEIKKHVVKQQEKAGRGIADVIGRTVLERAESMLVSDLDDVRSEVSSTVAPSSVAPRYSHSTIQTARKALRRAEPTPTFSQLRFFCVVIGSHNNVA